MSIEGNADAFISKHKQRQEEKQRLEIKLEMEKENLKAMDEKIKALGYKNIKALEKALAEKEQEILTEIGEN